MSKLNIKEQIHISKRLSFLLSANIPLLNSLKTLLKNSRSKREQKVLKFLIRCISIGNSLSEALRKSRAFDPFAIYLSEVGEASGTLGRNLGFVAEELEKKKRLRQNIQGALIYPVLIAVVSIVISVLLITFVFPKIIPILSGLNGKLPIATRVLIILSDFLKHFGIYSLVGVVLFSSLFILIFKRVSRFRYLIQSLLLRTPFIRDFSIYYQLSNFARTIGLLLQSGLVLEMGLLLLSEHANNELYKRSYQNIRRDILEGKRLASSMAKVGPNLFPSLFEEMVEVGEVTGELSKILLYLSNLYEEELSEKTKTISALVEPALMIFLGLIIGGVALSIIMPIYQITANLHH